jgi:hypothetical protein
MTPTTTVDVFISVLTELHHNEHRLRKARLRLRQKVRAARMAQEFQLVALERRFLPDAIRRNLQFDRIALLLDLDD